MKKSVLYLIIILITVVGVGAIYGVGYFTENTPVQLSTENARQYLARANINDYQQIFDAYLAKIDTGKEPKYIISYISVSGDPYVVILDQNFKEVSKIKLSRTGTAVKFNGFQFEKLISNKYYQPYFSLMSKNNIQINDLIVLGYVNGSYKKIFDQTITETAVNYDLSYVFTYQFIGKEGARDIKLADGKDKKEQLYQWDGQFYRLVADSLSVDVITKPSSTIVGSMRANVTGSAEKDLIVEVSNVTGLQAFVLRKEGDKWIRYDLPLNSDLTGQDLQDSAFIGTITTKDINKDGKNEIMLETAVGDTSTIYIFRWNGSKFENIFAKENNPFVIRNPLADINGDGNYEIITALPLIDYDRGENESNFSKWEITEYSWKGSSYQPVTKSYQPNLSFSPDYTNEQTDQG